MTIHVFHNGRQGAPTLRGQAGALIGVLDACLVDGFNELSASLNGVDGIVTATVTSHGFATGDVVQISGANETDFNGKFSVNVTGADTFTYQSTGTGDATGVITSKFAPPDGWEKTYSGTNLAAYRSVYAGANQLFLQVKDTTTTYGAVRGFESMADVSTGTNPFPTTAQVADLAYCWRKSSTADATARPWVIIADEKRFYFAASWHATYSNFGIYLFGDIPSFKAGDAYNTFLNADTVNNAANHGVNNLFTTLSTSLGATQAGKYLARPYTQVGPNPIAAGLWGEYGAGVTMGTGGMSYPYVVDGGLYVSPIMVNESVGLRGVLPGAYQPLHNTPLLHLGSISDIVGLPGKTLMAVMGAVTTTNAQVLFDITGPWE